MEASTTDKPMRQRMEEYVRSLQDEIVTALEGVDPSAPLFMRDAWQRPQGGSGQSCVLSSPFEQDGSGALRQQSTIIEKAGVNISIVYGTLPPAAIKQMRADHATIPLPEGPEGLPFFAAGLSLVIHPRNPHAPTVHANYRYFEITEREGPDGCDKPKILTWWFGGGSDLTPSYLYEEDAVHFHSAIKKACDAHGHQLYPSFKKWCDEYFHITHRGEARGIGGLFFDDLHDGEHKRLPTADTTDASKSRPRTAEEIFAFVKEAGNAFIPSYLPILMRRHSMPFNDHQRRWQLIRRGRYVEFNLVIDRGTKFGLMTPGGRIESILMSLPELARWEYMSEMGQDEATEEGRLVKVLKEPRDWV